MNDELLMDGFFIKAPRPGAPEFVKGSLSFNVDKAIAYLQTYKKSDSYVNADILLSKSNVLYLKRNTFEKKSENAGGMSLGATPDIEYPEGPAEQPPF